VSHLSPTHELFNEVRKLSYQLGYDTYDHIPDGNVAYPFVHVGEQFEQLNTSNKDRLFGQTQITVHVWHNDWRKRKELTDMMSAIERELWNMRSTAHLSVRIASTNKQVLTDTSTDSTLLHGVLEVDISYQ